MNTRYRLYRTEPLNTSFESPVTSAWLCVPGLKEFIDVPDSCRELDLVFTKQDSPYSFELYRKSPYSSYSYVDGYRVFLSPQTDNLINRMAERGYHFCHFEDV